MHIKYLLGLTLVAATAACGSSGGTAAPSTSTSSSMGSTSTGSMPSTGGAAGCGTVGQPGVLHTFCDGTATVTATLGGTTKTLTGGSCDQLAGMFEINAGTAIDSSAWPAGTAKPDYVGVIVDPATGKPSVLTARLGGVLGAAITDKTGSVDPSKKSATASGKTYKGDKISVTVTC